MSYAKTFMLLAFMSGLFFVVGDQVGGGRNVAYIALGFSLLLNFATYWFSDKMILKMYRAQPIGPRDPSGLYEIVEKLAQSQQMPMPKVYIIPEQSPNAFATGRNPKHAAVAATRGIMQLLNKEELEGVMAHELAHVKNRDILISTIAATFAAAINFLPRLFMFPDRYGRRNTDALLSVVLILVFTPLAAALIRSMISKDREYAADETGAKICKNPNALASALSRLESGVSATPMSECNHATAHMFIVNVFGRNGSHIRRGIDLDAMFDTHPPIDERVRRLSAMRR